MQEQQTVTGNVASTTWRLVIAFVTAGVICSAIASAAAVYVFGWFDAKFERAPTSALQVQLLDMGISLVAASVLFAIVVGARIRHGAGKSFRLAALLGAIYPIGSLLVWRMLMSFESESMVATLLAIAYVVLYPTIAGIAIRKA